MAKPLTDFYPHYRPCKLCMNASERIRRTISPVLLAALEDAEERFAAFVGPCERTDGAHCTMIPVIPCRACAARHARDEARTAIALARGGARDA